ncbi:MAG: hypothetical protein CMJ65_15605 [Planctomycetaceae bacterium]|nr:hypothetical protein [Planctomycetaceae bacterium]
MQRAPHQAGQQFAPNPPPRGFIQGQAKSRAGFGDLASLQSFECLVVNGNSCAVDRDDPGCGDFPDLAADTTFQNQFDRVVFDDRAGSCQATSPVGLPEDDLVT